MAWGRRAAPPRPLTAAAARAVGMAAMHLALPRLLAIGANRPRPAPGPPSKRPTTPSGPQGQQPFGLLAAAAAAPGPAAAAVGWPATWPVRPAGRREVVLDGGGGALGALTGLWTPTPPGVRARGRLVVVGGTSAGVAGLCRGRAGVGSEGEGLYNALAAARPAPRRHRTL